MRRLLLTAAIACGLLAPAAQAAEVPLGSRTFNQAYAEAQPGDVITVPAGSYGGQTLDASPKAGVVTFRGAGRTETHTGQINVYGGMVEFQAMDVSVAYNRGSARDVTWRDVHIGLFYVRGTDRVSFIDADVGPNNGNGAMNWVSEEYQTTNAAAGILFERVTVHDFTRPAGSSDHIDCIGVDNVDGFVVRDSVFRNCEAFDIIFGRDLYTRRSARNVVLENNFFDCCRSGYYAVAFTGFEGPGMVRFNSFGRAGLGWTGETGDVVAGLTFDSNILATNNSANCAKATWRNNVVASGSACAGGKLAATGFTDVPNVDYHLLPDAPALGFGNPLNAPAADIDGEARGSVPDAGADQRTVAPPPPPPDRDGDGVPDAEDACPDEAGTQPDGCNPPPPPPPYEPQVADAVVYTIDGNPRAGVVLAVADSLHVLVSRDDSRTVQFVLPADQLTKR